MHHPSRELPAHPTAGTLESLLAEALTLAERTRDALLEQRAARPAADESLLAILERSAALGAITTRVTASVAWLLARLAVVHGELDEATARAPEWRILPLGELARALPAAVDPELETLARESAQLYSRLQRLDAMLDKPAPVRH